MAERKATSKHHRKSGASVSGADGRLPIRPRCGRVCGYFYSFTTQGGNVAHITPTGRGQIAHKTTEALSISDQRARSARIRRRNAATAYRSGAALARAPGRMAVTDLPPPPPCSDRALDPANYKCLRGSIALVPRTAKERGISPRPPIGPSHIETIIRSPRRSRRAAGQTSGGHARATRRRTRTRARRRAARARRRRRMTLR